MLEDITSDHNARLEVEPRTFLFSFFCTSLTLNLLNFFKRTINLSVLDLSITIYGDIKMSLILASQQYRAWSDCTDVQTGLALYWWQSLITFASRRKKRVHKFKESAVFTYWPWFGCSRRIDSFPGLLWLDILKLPLKYNA